MMRPRCTSTCASRSATCCARGRCRRARRSTPRRGDWPCRSRTIHWKRASSRACTKEARAGTGAVIIWDEGTAEIDSDDPATCRSCSTVSKLRGRFGLTRTGEIAGSSSRLATRTPGPGRTSSPSAPRASARGEPGRRWRAQITRAPTAKTRIAAPATRRRRDDGRKRDDTARDLGAARLLSHQPDAGLLHLADRVQPARDRSVGAAVLLRQLLRLVRRRPSVRVRPAEDPARAVRLDRGRLQLPARERWTDRVRRGSQAGRRGATRRAGKAVFVFFDEETERRAAGVGLDVALPSAELRHRLDSKIITTQLGEEAGVPSVPNVLGRATTYPSCSSSRPPRASATTWSSRPRTATRARRRSSCAASATGTPTPPRWPTRSSR